MAPTTKKPKRVATEKEFEALLATCSPTSATGKRNRALLRLLWSCGPRISEALSLLPEDVDFERGVVTIHTAKTRPRGKRDEAVLRRKLGRLPVADRRRVRFIAAALGREEWDLVDRLGWREVAFNGSTADALRTWIEARKALLGKRVAPLFVSTASRPVAGLYRTKLGAPITTEAVRSWLTRATKAAGIRALGPHSFRHAAATRWAAGGLALSDLKTNLGHSALATTERYVSDLPEARHAATAAIDNPAPPLEDPRDLEIAELREQAGAILAKLEALEARR